MELAVVEPLSICSCCDQQYKNEFDFRLGEFDLCKQCHFHYTRDIAVAQHTIKAEWLTKLAKKRHEFQDKTQKNCPNCDEPIIFRDQGGTIVYSSYRELAKCKLLESPLFDLRLPIIFTVLIVSVINIVCAASYMLTKPLPWLTPANIQICVGTIVSQIIGLIFMIVFITILNWYLDRD